MRSEYCQFVFWVSFLIWWGTSNAQYYMYTPGNSIVPYMNSVYDTYGSGWYCGPISLGANCSESPFFDPTMCKYIPANVSATPFIDSAYLYAAPNSTGSILVSCNDWSSDASLNFSLFFTTNGTLPDIKGACHSNGVRCLATALVSFGPNSPPPFIVARCVQQGMIPSRIAYARRIPWDDTINGSWCNTPQAITALPNPTYRELSLPLCNHVAFGSQCDGQTVVQGAQIPTKSNFPTESIGSRPNTFAVFHILFVTFCYCWFGLFMYQ